MKIEYKISDVMGQILSELMLSTNVAGAASSSASNQPVQTELGGALVRNVSRTEQTGKLVVTPPTPEQCEILESEFGLPVRLIDLAGIEAVHYTPASGERVGTYCERVLPNGHLSNVGTPTIFKCNAEDQWNQWRLWGRFRNFVYLPPIPQGHSLRAPIRGAQDQVVGYVYYRLRLRSGDESHEIQRYWPTGEKPQVDARPSNYLQGHESVRFAFVDTVFQGLAVQQQGIAALSLNGILSRGFSAKGYFSFDCTVERRDQSWKPEDATALARLLNLPELLRDNKDLVIVLCEPNWLHQDSFAKSQFFLDQMKALSAGITAQGSNLSVVTPFSSGHVDEAVDLDHVLAGDWYSDNFHSGDHHIVEVDALRP